MTVQGQVDFMKDFLNRVANVANQKGCGFSGGNQHGFLFLDQVGQPCITKVYE